MKKRKELNALVANGKSRSQKKTATSTASCPSSQELLDGSETTDTEELSIFRARKSLNGRKASRLYVACMPLCMLTLVTASVVGSAMLIWMHLGLRQEVDMLRNYFRKVESGTRKTPEEFHIIHSRLNLLEGNSSLNKESVAKMSDTVTALSKDIENLRKTAENLSKSIAAAPEIETLPQTVSLLQQSLASLGSKLRDIDTAVKEMKEQSINVNKNMKTDIEGLQKKVESLSNASQVSTPQPSAQSILNTDEFDHLGGLVDDLNRTYNVKFLAVMKEIQQQHMVVAAIQNKSHNLNERLDVLERKVIDDIPSHINEIVPIKVNETIEVLLSTKLNETYLKNVTVKDALEYLAKSYEELLIKHSQQYKGIDVNGNQTLDEAKHEQTQLQEIKNISIQLEKLWHYVTQLNTNQTSTSTQLEIINNELENIRIALNLSNASISSNVHASTSSSPISGSTTASSQKPKTTTDKLTSTATL